MERSGRAAVWVRCGAALGGGLFREVSRRGKWGRDVTTGAGDLTGGVLYFLELEFGTEGGIPHFHAEGFSSWFSDFVLVPAAGVRFRAVSLFVSVPFLFSCVFFRFGFCWRELV